jgi:hypothetical protein
MRLRFLDWARGVAVVIMILCHTYNAYTIPALRQTTGYLWSQRIGGMASVLFLFMAGMTFAFQMSGSDKRELAALARWKAALGRACYLFALAYGFRLLNWAFYFGYGNWQGVYKVDILNCMGLSMAMLAALALASPGVRPYLAAAAGFMIAAVSPLLAMLDWSGVPKHLYAYIVGQRGAFAAFPFATYMAFGLAAGCLVKARTRDRLSSMMIWSGLAGATAIGLGTWFTFAPHTIYPVVNYWLNSPALVAINVGIALLVMVVSYVWAERIAKPGWSWIETLGKQSLLIYFAHIMLVYGWLFNPFKLALNVWQSGIATIALTAGMVWLANWRITRAEKTVICQPVAS